MNSPLRLRLISGLLLGCFGLLAPAHAYLGETFAEMKTRLGRPLQSQGKNVSIWLFEVIDGQLAYTVTFNAKGESIAEGLKPIRSARLLPEMAQEFIENQTKALAGSKTSLEPKPGEKYIFARQQFTTGPHEEVIVDDTRGRLIVFTKAPIPSIMAVTREMLGAPPPAAAAK